MSKLISEIKQLVNGGTSIYLTRTNGEVIEVTTNGHVKIISKQDVEKPQYGWFLFEEGQWKSG